MAIDINDPKYLAGLRKKAEASLAPTRDIAFKQIGLETQGIKDQEVQAKREANELTRILEENASKGSQSMEERYNQLGLLQSGRTAAGLGAIQEDLFRGKKETEQDKASRLASLALQRSGLGLRRAETQQQYVLGVNDLYGRLLDQARAEEERRLAAMERRRAASAAAGQGSAISQLMNLVAQRSKPQAAPKAPQISAKMFRSGKALNIDAVAESLIPELAQIEGTTGRVSMLKDLGFQNPEIADIMEAFNEPVPAAPQFFNKPVGDFGSFNLPNFNFSLPKFRR